MKIGDYLKNWRRGIKQSSVVDLSAQEIGLKEINNLLKTTALRMIEHLNLQDNNLDDEAAIQLSKAPFDKLRFLNLSGNKIGTKGREALLSSPRLCQVLTIDLDENPCGYELGHCPSREWSLLPTAEECLGILKSRPGDLVYLENLRRLDYPYYREVWEAAAKVIPKDSIFINIFMLGIDITRRMEFFLKGESLVGIHLDDQGDSDEDTVILELSDGQCWEAVLTADCGSVSFIADVVGVENVGSEVTGVEALSCEDKRFPSDEKPPKRRAYIKQFGFRIRTSTGPIDFVCRNESNGYYSGQVCSFYRVYPGPERLRNPLTKDYSF